MLNASEIKELINNIKYIDTYVPPNPPYFFSYKWMLEYAIKYYEDTEVIIVDIRTGDMWQRGKKLKERYGDNDE